MKARRVRTGISTAIAVSWLAAGGAIGLVSAQAASAATTAPGAAVHHRSLSVAHVSPFGVGATRAARPAPRRHAAPRHAAAPAVATTTEWVSNQVPVGGDTSCASPGYSTISSAISADTTDATIKVCAGTYDEQLVITQSVVLQAKGAVTVVAPVGTPNPPTTCDGDGGAGTPNQDIVDICGPGTGPDGINVTITGFTFKGSWPSDVCYDQIYGVAVLGGANLAMSKSTVEDVGGDPQTDGCQGGVGIEVGLALTGTTSDPGTATLTGDTVLNYQKNGITVDGIGSNAAISGATVTGTGETTAIAQNGIQVSDAATATILNSSISGNECDDTGGGCGPNGFNQVQDGGILLFDAGKTGVSGTTVTGNDIGVYNIEGYTIGWPFWSPPPGWKPVLDTFTSMGLNNRYENAYFDEGRSSLTASTLSGGEAGVQTAQWNGQVVSATSTATGDTITGTASIATNPTAAVLVSSDQAAGDLKVALTATGDRLDTSNAAGIANQTTSVVAATGDWWGDATGPSVWSFGSGSSVSADVNFFPWATDTTLANPEPCTSGTSVTANANDEVLCAPAGTGNAYLVNGGNFNVLIVGNQGNDQLLGHHATGETWIIGGTKGSNVINGRGGTGFIQERGDHKDTVINAASYTKAAS
jgi:hypothetical protein